MCVMVEKKSSSRPVQYGPLLCSPTNYTILQHRS
jgi:hypothetical protein